MFSPLGRLLALALMVAVLAGGLALSGSGFMVMLPALGLLIPLLLGCYPGEARIVSIRRSLALARLRLGASANASGPRAGHADLFRGGRLIAACLAVRPPPASA